MSPPSRPALIRPEALAYYQQQRRWGDLVLLQPVSTRLLTWGSVAAVAALLAFACWAPYARKVNVVGYVTPVAGTMKVFAPHAGVVQQVFVRQGDLVEKGQKLLTIGTDEIAADGKSVQTEILNVLNEQRRLLSEQIAAEDARQTAERHRLTATLKGFTEQMSTMQAQITAQSDRIKLAENLVREATGLHAKGYLSNLEFTSRQAAVIEQRQALDALAQQMLKLRNEITETQSTLDQLPTTMGEKVQILRNELANTEQRISQTEGQRAYTIRAPVAGRVSLLALSPGQTADPKRLGLELVPQGSALEAQLFVPAQAIGFVAAGERVRLMYDPFPYQSFGTYGGTVGKVSATMLFPSDATGPLTLPSPAYRITVTLDRAEVRARDRTLPLQPDMTLKANIILERRPLIRLILDPLLGTRL